MDCGLRSLLPALQLRMPYCTCFGDVLLQIQCDAPSFPFYLYL